jgi:hypothetical protein
MAEANEQHNRRKAYEEFAARQPGLTVLTDHALRPEQGYLDNFNLRYRLGPVYDILRYPETRTPMAIAVYGDWGTGKTTAMKWLHGLIDQWNTSGKAEKKINIRPVWFYPWKYDKKEDVWRGLIAAVIINAIYMRNPEDKKVTLSSRKILNGLKLLGSFGVNAVVDLASAAELQVPGVPGVKLSGSALREIKKHLRQAAHPEAPYLNEFEEALRKWVTDTLREDERMVIFIDDLDRCMPEIALQVLEALKLYLNIEKLIFIVGVDRKVVDKLVKEHYKRLGLDEDKSKNYLAKMFQVEVQVEPSEQQISDFLDEQLKDIPYWKEPNLSPDEQDLFRGLIFKLADHNPREVKRLINSALMTGAGAMMIETAPDSQGRIGFNQGLQLFFVRKILDDKYTMASEASSRRGIAFFRQWSQIVCEGIKTDRNFPLIVKVPERFGQEVPREKEDTGNGIVDYLDPKQASSLRLAQGEAAGFTGTCRPYPSRLAG